jgi:serine/threonine protein kinase
VRRALGECLKALSHLHSLNFIHRDIKPRNRTPPPPHPPTHPPPVLLSDDFGVKVADFGSTLLHNNTRTPSLAGTPFFLPPEKFDTTSPLPSQPPVPLHAHDVWSLGVTLLRLVIPRAVMRAVAAENIPFAMVPPALRAQTLDLIVALGYSPPLRALIGSMLAEDPFQRPTADAVLASLRTAPPPPSRSAEGQPIGAFAPPTEPPSVSDLSLCFASVDEEMTPPLRNEQAMASRPLLFFATDEGGMIVKINDAVRRVLGWRDRDVVARRTFGEILTSGKGGVSVMSEGSTTSVSSREGGVLVVYFLGRDGSVTRARLVSRFAHGGGVVVVAEVRRKS